MNKHRIELLSQIAAGIVALCTVAVIVAPRVAMGDKGWFTAVALVIILALLFRADEKPAALDLEDDENEPDPLALRALRPEDYARRDTDQRIRKGRK